MFCYIASKAKYAPFWAALRAAGINVSGTWPWWEGNLGGEEPTAEEWGEHSDRCITQASEADVLVLFVREGDQNFGSILETGAALAAGKQVFLVSPHAWPFLRSHPRVRSFDDLEAAVTALVAMQNGEKARRECSAKS